MKNNKVTQSKFFDIVAEFKSNNKLFKQESKLPGYINREMELFFDFCELARPLKILDIAAGIGMYTIPLLRRKHSIVATEISKKAIDAMEDRAERENLDLKTDLNSMEHEYQATKYYGKFDRVICVGGVHHFGLDKRDAIISNMAKCLKPNGLMVLLEPNPLNPLWYFLFFYNWLVYKPETMARWYVDKNIIHSHQFNLRKAFIKNGLNSIDVRYYAWLPNSFIGMCKYVEGINNMLVKIPLVKYLGAFIWIKGRVK